MWLVRKSEMQSLEKDEGEFKTPLIWGINFKQKNKHKTAKDGSAFWEKQLFWNDEGQEGRKGGN